jgi:hypothetical protein
MTNEESRVPKHVQWGFLVGAVALVCALLVLGVYTERYVKPPIQAAKADCKRGGGVPVRTGESPFWVCVDAKAVKN